MKALVGAFNQEKALVGAFSVIVQPVVDGSFYSTNLDYLLRPPTEVRVRTRPQEREAGGGRGEAAEGPVPPPVLLVVAGVAPLVQLVRRRVLLRAAAGLVSKPARATRSGELSTRVCKVFSLVNVPTSY